MPQPRSDEAVLEQVLAATLQDTAFVLFDPPAPEAREAGPYLRACITIGDARDTELRLWVPDALAVELAETVLAEPGAEAAQVSATVGELLNIIAGAWWAEQPDASRATELGVPTVDARADRPATHGLSVTLWASGVAPITLEAVQRA